MKLTIYRENLRPECASVNCSQTRFEHFDKKTQAAIVAVGNATFYEYDLSIYNVIYPPKAEE